jgi:hypothetical protein
VEFAALIVDTYLTARVGQKATLRVRTGALRFQVDDSLIVK